MLDPTTAALVALAAIIMYVLKKIAWDDRPIPSKHRVSKEYYSHSPRRFMLTGCASGVGKHFVTRLVREGHWVVATDINMAGLQKVANELDWNDATTHLVQLDVTKAEQWDQAIADAISFMGGIDVLFNIAGYLAPNTVLDVTDRQIELHCDVNLKGVAFGTCKVARIMAAQVERGDSPCGTHIVNFSSLGAIAPVQGVGLYIGSKYGCRGFTLSASKDLFDAGVYCTVVCPDAIQTPMVDLQLHHAASAIAFSGDILTLEQVEDVVFSHCLPNRPREVLIATSFTRGKMARMADVFSGVLVIAWAEAFMVWLGSRNAKAKLLSTSGGSSMANTQSQQSIPRSTLDFMDQDLSVTTASTTQRKHSKTVINARSKSPLPSRRR